MDFEKKVLETFEKYYNYCKRSQWLRHREAYKFRFGRWIDDNIDFSKQSDEEVLNKCIKSQEVKYDGKEIGVNFLNNSYRFNDEIITLKDIKLLRKLNDDADIEIDISDSPMSYPNLTCWAGSIIKNGYWVIAAKELYKSIAYLLNDKDYPKSGIAAFKYGNKNIQHIYDVLRQNLNDHIHELIGMIFPQSEIREVDIRWLLQDFLLFIEKRILTMNRNYYWVCQGANYEEEKKAGIIKARKDATIYYHKLLKELLEGDVLLSYTGKKVSDLLKVQNEFIEKDNLVIVGVKYFGLKKPLDIDEVKKKLVGNKVMSLDQGPFDKNGGIKQGYLFKFTEEAFKSLIDPEEQNLFDAMNVESGVSKMDGEIKNGTLNNAKNQILYGPPGTGKTYYLKDHFFPIFTDYQSIKTRGEFADEIVGNLTWWETIALVLLDLGKAKVNDITAHELMAAKIRNSNAKHPKNSIWLWLQRHTHPDSETVKLAKRDEPYIFDKTENSIWEINKQVVEKELPELIDVLDKFKKYRSETKEEKRYRFTTFHQSFTYEDFIEGIKPDLQESEDSVDTDIRYHIEDGIFYKCCNRAVQLAKYDSLQHCINDSKENQSKAFENAPPFALFIDEINRGNIASIFGELITLIEEDKRITEQSLVVELPYSKRKFAVPPNLHIIGTMNTADRSVEALDTALRRRFSFKEMVPSSEVIKKYYEDNTNVDGINLVDVFEKINERIEILLDKDHMIGHSYFLGIKGIEDFQIMFKDKIIPLLQEYFFGDFGKIGLVLGDGFIEKVKNKNDAFAKINGYEPGIYLEKEIFRVRNIDKIEDFSKAIQTLLGKVEQ